MSERAVAYARRNRRRFVSELGDLVRIPSVSAEPAHAPDVRRCAQRLANELRRIGLHDVAVLAAGRHPSVIAHWRGARSRPTLLIYGHYDVQPADPAQWRSPPFEPVVRDGCLFGRGAADDKGQLLAHVKAIESYLATSRRLPVNVTCLFEGEEEIGSPGLRDFVMRHRSRLRADAAAMSDTRMLGCDRPAITYALRGSLGLELEVRGPPEELHSGNYGGAVHDPVQALCAIVARLRDGDGRIDVPGLYDRVVLPSPSAREKMRQIGPTDGAILRAAGVSRRYGERGFTAYEGTTIRPALVVNGIAGGYQGPGGKSIIATSATAKLQLRLVPEQDPIEVEALVRRRIAQLTPPSVFSRVRSSPGAPAVVVDRNHPAMAAAARAYERGFGRQPVFVRSGGTIPVVGLLRELYAIPTVLMGFGLPSSGIHGPNENFHLGTFQRGVETCIAFLDILGRQVSSRPTSRAPANTIAALVRS